MAIKSAIGGDYALGERSDDELVALARSGGSRTGVWDELYRRHAPTARSVARHLLRSRHDADDVVNEAFAGVIAAINHGSGPHDNFRPYLMACVRNGCRKRSWKGATTISTDPSHLARAHGEVLEDPERFSEAGLVAAAFSSLSTDWQRVLWMTAVEDRSAADVAREMGRRPAAAAALAHRAREAFAEAYLTQHQHEATAPECARITPKLAMYVRGRAGDIDHGRIEHHLTTCVGCSRAVEELRDLNASLRSLALPATLTAGAGAGVAVVAAVPIAAASLGGFAVFGATLAKVAALAALVVPAVVIASEAGHEDTQITTTADVVDTVSNPAQDLIAAGPSSAAAPIEVATTEPPAPDSVATTTATTLVPATTIVADPDATPTTPTISTPVIVLPQPTVPAGSGSGPVSPVASVVAPVVSSASSVVASVGSTASTVVASASSLVDSITSTAASVAAPVTTLLPTVNSVTASVGATVTSVLAGVGPVVSTILATPLTVADKPLPSFPLPLPKIPDILNS